MKDEDMRQWKERRGKRMDLKAYSFFLLSVPRSPSSDSQGMTGGAELRNEGSEP